MSSIVKFIINYKSFLAYLAKYSHENRDWRIQWRIVVSVEYVVIIWNGNALQLNASVA